VGRDLIGKKGVVRDPNDQAEAIGTVLTSALSLGWQYGGVTWSPLVGPAGNIEYLLWLTAPLPTVAANSAPPPNRAELQDLVLQARAALG
jgi:23S rRNA (cytidine1920-2'-O)/16S rRNA (cytidine1409-2'-O)-methyltransferase